MGKVVASTYRFVDIYEINFVFSDLFCIDSFLDYLIKQNDIDQPRFVLDGHPLPIEYHKLTEAYKLRNDIAHEVTEVNISKSRDIAMWDNLGNIMDLSNSLFYSVGRPEHRRTLDSLYEQGKYKMVKNAIYKLSSDKIMSELLENRKTLVIGNGNVIFLDVPALHLHPTKIEYFGRKLMGMSEKQIIVITHSPYFVELSLFSNGRNLVSVRKIGLVTSRQRHKV